MTPAGTSRLREEIAESLREVEAVYEALAIRPIERSCTTRAECCHFKLTGRTPYLTLGEALVAAQAFRASGRKQLPGRPDGACPLLHGAHCMIYEGRPFGCRTHFCAAAGGPYERAEVLDLIRRLEAVDSRLGGVGPRKLGAAVSGALEMLGSLSGRRASTRRERRSQ